MKRPAEIQLSHEDGEALRTRLAGDALTTADRRVLGQVLQWYFGLMVTLQEATLSLKRLRALVFGERPTKRTASPVDTSTDSTDDAGTRRASAEANLLQAQGDLRGVSGGARHPGHGRQSAEAYSGAEPVVCRHETLAVGERCPVCGRGRLYRIEPGVDIRLDGHALLSAVRSTLEKFRCSACGQVFTAALPDEAGQEKYSARARAVLVLGRYYLGVPLYRLEGYQAMVGGPVSDATQWDHIERVADCAYPVFEDRKGLAAQGEGISQDDTPVRILSLIAENRRRQADGNSEERTGMYTTALVVQQGAQTICLYFAGRAHAGGARSHFSGQHLKREGDRS